MSTTTTEEKTYDCTIAEMVDRTGFSMGAFGQWVRKGMLSAQPDGNRYLLNEKEVMEFVSSRKTRKKFLSFNSTA